MNVLALNAMLSGLVAWLGAGARIEIYAGDQPAQGGAPTVLLVPLVLANPAGTVDAGALTFVQANTSDGDMATGTGLPKWARLRRADGTWVRDYTASGADGEGDIKIEVLDAPAGDPSGKIYLGGRVFLGTVTLGQ